MASPTHFLMFPLISVLILGVASPYTCAQILPSSCSQCCEQEFNFPPYYLHQVAGGANPNQQMIVSSSYPNGFGSIAANDWTMLDAPISTANIIARARGMHIQVAQAAGIDWQGYFSIVFQDASYGGSTLKVMGDNIGGPTGEWSIIGGTGKLSMARGTIKYTVIQIDSVENYRKLDFYGTYVPPLV